jgi:adenylate kinase
VNIILVGPPGSGKGTQGALLAEKLDVEHIAAGDLLRAEVASGTPIGNQVRRLVESGGLVPDQLVIDMIVPRVLEAAKRRGYVLDGFPRTVPQAKAARALLLNQGAAAELVIYLSVTESVLVERLVARARVEGRADDTREVITRRLKVFREATQPLVDHYSALNLVRVIDADRPVDDVTDIILAVASGTRNKTVATSEGAV